MKCERCTKECLSGLCRGCQVKNALCQTFFVLSIVLVIVLSFTFFSIIAGCDNPNPDPRLFQTQHSESIRYVTPRQDNEEWNPHHGSAVYPEEQELLNEQKKELNELHERLEKTKLRPKGTEY